MQGRGRGRGSRRVASSVIELEAACAPPLAALAAVLELLEAREAT